MLGTFDQVSLSYHLENSELYVFWQKRFVEIAGFPQSLEIMENLENHQKKSMHGKIMELE